MNLIGTFNVLPKVTARMAVSDTLGEERGVVINNTSIAACDGQIGQQAPFPSRLGRPDEYALLMAAIIANPMLNGGTIRLDGAIHMVPQ